MTVQQEAISIINNMPDDVVSVLVELLKRMTPEQVTGVDFQNAEKSMEHSQKRVLGIADGKYNIPDNIDVCNEEIAQMFGVI